MHLMTLAHVESANNLPFAFFQCAETFPIRPAQWYRHDGDYLPVTYRQLHDRILQVASGLIAAGIQPGDRVAIMMENRPEWAIADYAILSIGAVSVPLYCCYRADDIAYVLNDCEAVATIVSGGDLLRHLRQAAPNCPNLGPIYALEEAEGVTPFAELLATTIDARAIAARLAHIGRDTLASLVYTSGTTAHPKGVMLTHGNFLTNVAAALHLYPLRDDDKMLSFLPLAHCLERMGGHFFVYTTGISVAFAERPDTVARNLAEAQPTILVTVPRLLEVMQSRIEGQVAKQPPLRRWLFQSYVERYGNGSHEAANFIRRGRATILDKMVGRKVRARFGGRLRGIISGGAPLPPSVARFFEALLLPVIEGYGLTESAPILTANLPHARKIGSVGIPVRGVEIRLSDEGEIMARGDNVMAGYWRQPEATAQTLVDGWLLTGDIGAFDEEGYLRITDRKKEIIVNSGGENVAPSRIESLLASHPMIDQVVVYGDRRPYLVALVAINEEAGRHWVSAQGIECSNWQVVLQSDQLRKRIQSDISALLKPLSQHEQVRRIHLLATPLTLADGLLTPTLKVKRRKVYERYAEILEQLYS